MLNDPAIQMLLGGLKAAAILGENPFAIEHGPLLHGITQKVMDGSRGSQGLTFGKRMSNWIKANGTEVILEICDKGVQLALGRTLVGQGVKTAYNVARSLFQCQKVMRTVPKPQVQVTPVTTHATLPKQLRPYIRDVENKSNLKTTERQRTLLADALRNKEYKELPQTEKLLHTQKYKNPQLRERMISDWEMNTGQKWPTEIKQVNGEIKPVRDQVHHIIPQEVGGPHEWWNIHPIAQPKHQGGVHGKGSPLNDILKNIKN